MNDFSLTEHHVPIYKFNDMLRLRFYIHADVFPRILAAAYFHENDFPLPTHARAFWELNVVTAGEGVHYVNGISYPVKAGNVFVIPPHCPHGYEESKKLTVFHLELSDAFLKKYRTALKELIGTTRLLQTDSSFQELVCPVIPQNDFVYCLHELQQLAKMSLADESGVLHETNKCVKVLNLLADIVQWTTPETEQTSKDAFIDTPSVLKAVHFIEENYHTNVTVEQLCKISNMSRSSLLKQFALLCKCSPAAYLTRVRIENACQKLRLTNHSIARIAQDCGFYDSSHFTKSFAQLMKMRPKEYRSHYKHVALSK